MRDFTLYTLRPGSSVEAILGLKSIPDDGLQEAIVRSGIILTENGKRLSQFQVYHRIINEREQQQGANDNE